MAKLRHIAIAVNDPETAARFFESAFGMTRAGSAQRGVYLTDGVINVALLNFADEPIPGFEQQNLNGRVFSQTIGERATGRAGPDDDVIRNRIGHGLSSQPGRRAEFVLIHTY